MKLNSGYKLNISKKKVFYRVFFPALAETIIACLFHMVDSMMIGQMPQSTLAVAAVGMCTAPVNLTVCVTSAFFIGTTATVAWQYGAGNKKEVRNIAWQSMIIAVIVAVVFTAMSFFGSKLIMGFVCEGSDAFGLAESYYHINAYGFFFQIITMNITAAFRGIGITLLPLLYNLGGSAINVGLNYILIYGKLGFPAMGVEGAAWATVISKIVSFAVAIIFLFAMKSDIRIDKNINLRPTNLLLKRMIPIGLTSAAEQLLLQGGAILSTKIIAVLPTAEIASSQVVASLESFAWSSGNACCTAATSLFGRSLGEGSEPKAKAYLKLVLKWAIGCALVEIIAFSTLGKPLASLFTNDASLYPMIAKLLIISAMALPFINSHQSVSGALRSSGDSMAPLVASLVSLWIFRVGMGFVTIRLFDFGITAYRYCMMADQMVRCATVVIFFVSGHWKKKARKFEKAKPNKESKIEAVESK